MYNEMLSRRGWPNSTETRFTAMKSMGIPLFKSATSHLKFVHERYVTSSEHEGIPVPGLPRKQKLKLHQVGYPIKRHTDLFKYGYL